MSDVLRNLNVIITRPESCGVMLKEKVLFCQGKAALFPTIQICPATISANEIKDLNINQYDLIIFTGRNAVSAITKILPQIKGPKLMAIGPSTASALQQQGLFVAGIPVAKFDSEHLLALPDFIDVSDKRILIITGEGGRNFLDQTLIAKGARVVKWSVYRRELPDVSEEAARAITKITNPVIVITSGEGLRNLVAIMTNFNFEAWLFKCRVLVISHRMMALAVELGFKQELLLEAPNATDDAILECLIKWYSMRV
jgi:uroporphyrinogen-III synthase